MSWENTCVFTLGIYCHSKLSSDISGIPASEPFLKPKYKIAGINPQWKPSLTMFVNVWTLYLTSGLILTILNTVNLNLTRNFSKTSSAIPHGTFQLRTISAERRCRYCYRNQDRNRYPTFQKFRFNFNNNRFQHRVHRPMTRVFIIINSRRAGSGFKLLRPAVIFKVFRFFIHSMRQ